MDIGVRSGIDRGEKKKRDRNRLYADDISQHATVFLLASVSPHPSIGGLIKQVDANAIAEELIRVLEANGFRAVLPDQSPQIVITVDYGRGWLPNPYSDDSEGKDFNNLTNSDVLSPPWHMKEIFFSLGQEMKRQQADQEKLIIQVKAWRYTPDPKQKPQLVWMTTMHVDDPEHRDLNEIYKTLLAAGAPHFDQPIDREREVIVKGAPEGRVKVGTPEVVPEEPINK